MVKVATLVPAGSMATERPRAIQVPPEMAVTAEVAATAWLGVARARLAAMAVTVVTAELAAALTLEVPEVPAGRAVLVALVVTVQSAPM